MDEVGQAAAVRGARHSYIRRPSEAAAVRCPLMMTFQREAKLREREEKDD